MIFKLLNCHPVGVQPEVRRRRRRRRQIDESADVAVSAAAADEAQVRDAGQLEPLPLRPLDPLSPEPRPTAGTRAVKDPDSNHLRRIPYLYVQGCPTGCYTRNGSILYAV